MMGGTEGLNRCACANSRGSTSMEPLTAETDIVPSDGFIQIPQEKVIDTAIPQTFLCGGVLLFSDLAGKGNAAFAGLRLDELEELLTGEIAGTRGHQVEETGLLLRVAELHNGLRMDGK